MNGTIGIGKVLSERYKLERPLAHGGMGAVWRAEDLRLGVPVAVKLMSPVFLRSEEARARFELEGRMTARLRGPHIAQLFDVGVDAGIPYMVMELLGGEDLQSRLSREKRLSLEAASHIGGQIARALEWAHSFGVVHRDVKPANVFLARSGVDEVVKVLDFGVAKWGIGGSEDEGTRTGMLMGSPGYMSPEQIASARAVGPRADLWSFGAVLFHMVCGWPPFPADTTVEVLRKIRAGDTPLASAFATDLPVELDAFFLRALAVREEDRFSSAGAMATAFACIAARRTPVVAPPAVDDTTEDERDDVPTTAFLPAITDTGTEYLAPDLGRSSSTYPRAHVLPATVQAPLDSGVGFFRDEGSSPLDVRPARSVLQRWPTIVLAAMVPVSALVTWLLAGRALHGPPADPAAVVTAATPATTVPASPSLPSGSPPPATSAPASSPSAPEGDSTAAPAVPSGRVAMTAVTAVTAPSGARTPAPPSGARTPALPSSAVVSAGPSGLDTPAPNGAAPSGGSHLVRGRSSARK